MNPEDLMQRLVDLEARTTALARMVADTVCLAPIWAELDEALVIAAGKRGSRRWARTTWEPFSS